MNNWRVSSEEFPYFDAVRRLELYIKQERRNIRKLQNESAASLGLTTPGKQWTANEGYNEATKLYILHQLIMGLEEALTGLKGHEVGRSIMETEAANTGNSWRHDLAYKTSDYRFKLTK
jgi:hypothetical protein